MVPPPINKAILKAQLASAPPKSDVGADLYQYLFEVDPSHRDFFKGDEKITADGVIASERFRRQGKRVLTSIHILVELTQHPLLFHAYLWDHVWRHRDRHVPDDRYMDFFNAFFTWLEKKSGGMSAEQMKEWYSFRDMFIANLYQEP